MLLQPFPNHPPSVFQSSSKPPPVTPHTLENPSNIYRTSIEKLCIWNLSEWILGVSRYILSVLLWPGYAPVWGLCADLLEKSHFFFKIAKFSCRCSNWLQIAKNNFSRFLAFYPLISAFQASPHIPID